MSEISLDVHYSGSPQASEAGNLSLCTPACKNCTTALQKVSVPPAPSQVKGSNHVCQKWLLPLTWLPKILASGQVYYWCTGKAWRWNISLADAVKGERNHFFASLIIKLWWHNFFFMKICVKVTASQTSYSKNRPAFGFKRLAFAENCSENFICR